MRYKKNHTGGENLFEIKFSMKWYTKNISEKPIDRRVENVHEILSDQNLLVVPLDDVFQFLRKWQRIWINETRCNRYDTLQLGN